MGGGHKPASLLVTIVIIASISLSTGQLLNLGADNPISSLLGLKKSTSSLPLTKVTNVGLLQGAGDLLGIKVLKSLTSLAPSAKDLTKIDSGLLEVLSISPKSLSNVLVKFGGNQEVIDEIESQSFPSIVAKRTALVKALKRHAEKKQSLGKSLFPLLNVKDFQSFWVANNMIVSGGDLNLVRALSLLTEVTSLSIPPTIKLEPLVSPDVSLQNIINSGMDVQWGVKKIQAPEVWEAGIRGQGVCVATIDSGVHGTHEALLKNKRATNSWFDPYNASSNPIDENGHGTHTMGTICGANGIGVAPDSEWIACRGCSSSACEAPALLACAQWMLAPTNPDGTGADPTLAPNIVSNSWGSPIMGGDDWYNPVVKAWAAGGILSCFANGNSGPRCQSSGSPGDQLDVFSVGATDIGDNLASFSSKGPAGPLTEEYKKPDISAPGEDIYSCWNGNDNAYNTISGTSMATPHVAGVMALILSGYQTAVQDNSSILSMADITTAIKSSADTEGLTLDEVNAPCDVSGVTGKGFPNNQFGFGRINALACCVTVVKESLRKEAAN